MPRIPIGNFGNAISEGAPRVNIPAGAFDQREGLAQLARTGQVIASNEIETQRAEAKRGELQAQAEAKAEQRRIEAEQRAEDNRNRSQLESAQRMSAYLSFNSDVSMQTAEISDQLQAGKLKRDEVFPLFDLKIAELQKKHLDGLDPIAQETVKAHMITGQRTAALHLRQAVKSSVKHETLALIEKSKEDLGRLAVTDPEKATSQFNTMMDALGSSVMEADQVEKAKNSFAERSRYTHYTAREEALRHGGSDGGRVAGKDVLSGIAPDLRQKLKYDAPELDLYAAKVEADKGLPAGLLLAIKNAGERSNSNQVSSAGAQGVMQFIPSTWRQYGKGDPKDPKASIDAAGAYFAELMKRYKGNIDAAITEYNGGMVQAQAVANGGKPTAAETAAYLPRVKEYMARNASVFGRFDALTQEVMADPVLDPDRKTVILGRINGTKERLANAAERADKARMDGIQRQISEVDGLILKGFTPTTQQMLDLQTAAKGTPYEDVVKNQLQFASSTAAFREMNPRGQENAINELEAAVRAQPSPDGIKTLESMRAIFTNQTEAVKKDPQSFAAQKGLYVVEPINLLQPTTLNDQLAKRVTTARAMRDQYGSPMQVFTTQETDFIKQSFSGMLPDKKLVVLDQLAKGIGDPVAIRDTAAQLDKTDKSLATALFLAGKGYITDKGRNLAELYLKGADALDSKKVPASDVSANEALRTIREKLANVYSTADGRDKAIDVAFKLWAAGQSEKIPGITNVRGAIEAATGGLMDTAGGGTIAKPYGMKDGEFTDKIKALKAEHIIAMAGGVDTYRVNKVAVKAADIVKMLPGARLQTVGDGAYAIVAGPDYVRLPDNRPLVIRVR